jgi:hypothetical protein
MLAFEGDSQVVWFEGNYEDYEKDFAKAPGHRGRPSRTASRRWNYLKHDGGVIYYPQGISEGSDYTVPTALPDYLKHIGLAGHAFTSETPDLLEDGRVLNVDQRAAGHVAAIRAALKAVQAPGYPRSL